MGPRTERILALEKPGYPVKPRQDVFDASEILHQQAQLPRESASIDDIQNAVLNGTLTLLPDAFITQFRFDQMRWQLLLKHNALSAFYLGSTSKPGKNISLDEAESVIELRTTVWGDKGQEVRATTVPEVRTSSTAADSSGQTRAVGSTYSRGLLTKVNVSFSDTEFLTPEQFPYDEDTDQEYARITRSIPSNIDHMRYDTGTAGFITRTMMNKTPGHNRVLVLNVYRDIPPEIPFNHYPNHGLAINGENNRVVFDFNAAKRTRVYSAEFTPEHPVPVIPVWTLAVTRALDS